MYFLFAFTFSLVYIGEQLLHPIWCYLCFIQYYQIVWLFRLDIGDFILSVLCKECIEKSAEFCDGS